MYGLFLSWLSKMRCRLALICWKLESKKWFSRAVAVGLFVYFCNPLICMDCLFPLMCLEIVGPLKASNPFVQWDRFLLDAKFLLIIIRHTIRHAYLVCIHVERYLIFTLQVWCSLHCKWLPK